MNPMIKKMLMDKYGENFEQDAQNQYDESTGSLNNANLFSNLGDVIAGNKVGSNNAYFDGLKKESKESTLGKIDKAKKDYMTDSTFDNQQQDAKIKQDAFDPTSSQSSAYRKMMEAKFPDVVKTYGDSWNNVSAGDQDNIFKPLQLRETIDGRKEAARLSAGSQYEARADRNEARELARNDKLAEKAKLSDKQLEAFTDLENAESDLNNLLASVGEKKEWTGPLDSRVPDMFVGADQVAFRSAVGKYKDAYRKAITGAGAGPSEIAILESRLPTTADMPANFKSKSEEALKELSRRRGTMSSNLKKNGKDVSKFEGVPAEKTKTVVKTLTSPSTGAKKVIYSDGTEEIIQGMATNGRN